MSQGPRSLLAADASAPLFDREQSLALARRVVDTMSAVAASIAIGSSAPGNTEFALNEVQGGEDSFDQSVSFVEHFERRSVSMVTNVLDDASLKAAVMKAEAFAKGLTVLRPPPGPTDALRPIAQVNPLLWSDSSMRLLAPEVRLDAIERAMGAVKAAGLVGSGFVSVLPGTIGVLTKDGHYEYGRRSTCAFSITARSTDGTGSGWAAWEGEDWSACDVGALAAHAIDLGLRSKDPVAVEPGRYTVVLTPEATDQLTSRIAQCLSGPDADAGGTPFSKPGGGNKIGLKVLDERLSLWSDPLDVDGGFLPFTYNGMLVQYVPATWIRDGVLRLLSYPTREMAVHHGLDQVNNPGTLRMSSGPTTIDEMIARTERGIYVTRFSNVSVVSEKTLYLTGVTQDGTLLIEKGKITKPLKNMRFEDSPFFFLNNLGALGPAKRVPGGNVMPAVLARDFAFTSLTDAV